MVYRRWKSAFFILVLLLAVSVSGCGEKKTEETTPEIVEAPTSPAETEIQPVQETEDFTVVSVNTPYGTLYYQEQWSEHMQVDQKEADGVLQVSFAAEFNGVKYPLFDLLVGVGEDEAVAQLTGPDGTARGIGVNFLELGEYPELAEDQRNQLYAMQEDINFIVENIN